MSKGTYNVQNRRRQSIDDTSWKSCTCALLIFLTLCILIILLSWNWRHPHQHEEFGSQSEYLNKKDDVEKIDVDDTHDEDYDYETNKFEKIIMKHYTSTTEKPEEKKDEKFKERVEHINVIYDYDYFTPKHPKEDDYITTTIRPTTEKYEESTLPDKEKEYTELESKEVEPFEEPYTTEKPKTTTEEFIITTTEPIEHTTVDAGTTYEYSTLDSTTTDLIYTTESTTLLPSDEVTTVVPHDDKVATKTYTILHDDEVATKSYTKLHEDKVVTKMYTTESTTASETRKMYAGIPLTTPMTIKKYTALRTYSMSYLKDTCNSTICKTEASNILSLIDHDKNPCDGFYEYACHGMSDPMVAELNMEEDVWRRIEGKLDEITSSSPEYLKHFKSYYSTCVNHNPDVDPYIKEKFRKHLAALSKFRDHATTDKIPPTCKLITDLIKRNFVTFFDLKIEVDKDSGNMGLAIIPTTYKNVLKTFFGDNSYVEKCLLENKANENPVNLNNVYDKYKNCETNLDSYMEMARTALEFAGAFSGSVNETHDMDETLNILKHIMLMIQKYAPHPLQVKTASEVNSQYITVKELRELAETFLDFEFAFQSILEMRLDDDDKIRVYFLENFKNIMTNIPFDKLRVVNNGILAMYAQSIYKDFVIGRNRPFDRHKICLKAATDLMVDVTSYMYLSSFDDKEIESTNKIVQDIFESINETLEADLKLGDVLADPFDKNKAAEAMENIYLYALDKNRPWKDEEFLINRISTVNLTGEFMADTTNLQENYRNLMYQQYLNNPKLAEIIWTYIKTPYDTKISSIKNLNLILIPMGAIQHLKDSSEIPKSLTMADLGFKLAKEIFIYLESKSILVFTDDRETRSKNINISDFMNQQMVEFQLSTSNLFANDIIPDIAAIKLAHSTYQRKYDEKISNDFPVLWLEKSWEELYFIRVSQNFCTKQKFSKSWINMFEENEVHPLVTTNTMVVNLPDILATFNCKGKEMQGGFHLASAPDYDPTISTDL